MEREQVIKLLDDLGDTPNKIAASLKEKGIKGKPSDNESCPIAIFLIQEGASYDRFCSVGCNRIILYLPGGRGANIMIPTSTPIRAFTMDFDYGKYPELESK